MLLLFYYYVYLLYIKKMVATGSADGIVHIFDVSNPHTSVCWQKLDNIGIKGQVYGVCYNPLGINNNNPVLLTYAGDGIVRVYSTKKRD
jgi:WD40 repeat protein